MVGKKKLKVMTVNLEDSENVLELFDTVFSGMSIQNGFEVIMVLLCSSIASSVNHIIEPEERYKMGEKGIRIFCDDVLEMYEKGREKADVCAATREAEKATKM